MEITQMEKIAREAQFSERNVRVGVADYVDGVSHPMIDHDPVYILSLIRKARGFDEIAESEEENRLYPLDFVKAARGIIATVSAEEGLAK